MSPRVAIVTGAAQGLGRAIALKLVKDGLHVAVNDIPSKRAALENLVTIIKGQQGAAVAVPADISSEEGVQNMIQSTVSQYGQLDVMVANAGVVVMKPLLTTSMDEYDRLMKVNSRGVMMCFKYAAKQMVYQGSGGKLIAASSIAGKRGLPNIGAYSMSKFGVRGLVQSFSQELREHRIHVNAYAPGTINTDLATEARNMTDEGLSIPEMIGLPKNTPMGRPEDIATLVSYLSRPESDFVNGQTITIDGGVIFD